MDQAREYVRSAAAVAAQLQKPLLVEELGLARVGGSFTHLVRYDLIIGTHVPTVQRDTNTHFLCSQLLLSGTAARDEFLTLLYFTTLILYSTLPLYSTVILHLLPLLEPSGPAPRDDFLTRLFAEVASLPGSVSGLAV